MSKKELLYNTENIEKIERYFQVKFPNSYKEIIAKNEKMYPESIDYELDIPGYGIINFNFQRLLEEEFINFTRAFSDRIFDTKRIIPFASNSNGDVLLFDYIENTYDPAVLYMEHEEALCIKDITSSQLKVKSLEEWIEGNFIFVSTSFEKLNAMIYI